MVAEDVDALTAMKLELLAARELALRREVEIERLRAGEARLVATAMEAERVITAQQGLLSDREHLLEARGELLAEREKVIAALEDQIREARAEKERLEAELAELRQVDAQLSGGSLKVARSGRLRRRLRLPRPGP